MTQPTSIHPPVTGTTTDWAPPTGPPAWAPPAPPAPAKKSRKGLWALGILAVILGLAAVGGASDKDATTTSDGVVTTPSTIAPLASTSAATSSSSLGTWAVRYGQPDAGTLGDDLTAIASDAGSMDITGLAASCRTFQRHLTTAGSHLPTPDAQLTSSLREAYGYYGQAATACIRGTATMDPADISLMGTYLEMGTTPLSQATARLKVLD